MKFTVEASELRELYLQRAAVLQQRHEQLSNAVLHVPSAWLPGLPSVPTAVMAAAAERTKEEITAKARAWLAHEADVSRWMAWHVGEDAQELTADEARALHTGAPSDEDLVQLVQHGARLGCCVRPL